MSYQVRTIKSIQMSTLKMNTCAIQYKRIYTQTNLPSIARIPRRRTQVFGTKNQHITNLIVSAIGEVVPDESRYSCDMRTSLLVDKNTCRQRMIVSDCPCTNTYSNKLKRADNIIILLIYQSMWNKIELTIDVPDKGIK